MESLTLILIMVGLIAVVSALAWWDRQKRRKPEWQQQQQEKQHVKEQGQQQEEQRLKEQRQQQQKQIALDGQQILDRHSDVVNKFLEIAERKVSVLDDYGDERMHLLWKELEECIRRLATREGSDGGLILYYTSPIRDSVTLAYAPWKWVRLRLRELFIEYHELQKKKVRTINEINLLSGAEFESYVARILQQCGWHVSGTPTTGDQGADLIASKGNRKIAIQVKRYTSSVGNSAVQEVVGAVRFYGANEGCVITNSHDNSLDKG